MADGIGKMPLRAIHQFHGGSAIGDGITNGMLFTRRLLCDLGLQSEIYAANPAPELRGDIHPHTAHPGASSAPDELLLVHYSMGHEAHAWIDAVRCPKVLIYHNITPERFLGHETFRQAAALGRQQIAHWGNLIANKADAPPFRGAIADSDFNLQALRAAGFDPQLLPMETLPLLVDLDLHRRKAGAPFAEPLPEAPPPAAQLLFVGRLAPHKCQHELILALAHLRPRLTRPVRLTLVGDGDPGYVAALRETAIRENVADAVEITGKISDEALGEYYRKADLFICLSEHEGFCMPLIEAAIHQIPVLAYGGGGAIAETLGEGGLILTRKNPEEIAAAAALLLEEPALRRRVLQGQKANLARFDPEGLKLRLAGFIEGLGFTLPLAASEPATPPPHTTAYRIEGPYTSSYSLALVNRELGLALARGGKTVQLRSVEGGIGQFPPDASFLAAHPQIAALAAETMTSGIEADPADICLRNMYPPRADDIKAAGIKGLACYAWEETGFPRAYAEAMNRSLDLITVTSAHVKQILQDNGVHAPIAVVGDGADHLERSGRPSAKPRAEALIGTGAPGFRFLHVSSGFPRKGVDLLLQAWEHLSQDASWHASLIIKTFPNPHNSVVEMVQALQQANPKLAPIVIIQEELRDDEILGLYEACDAIIAPSRAEGYGLPLAEAMLAGKPVITTAWGGQTDFCNDDTAWLVDWNFAPAKTHLGVAASVWAEPKLDDLIRQMRALRSATIEALAPRLTAAKDLLRAEHSWDHVAARVNQAVAALSSPAPATGLALPKIALVSTWGSRCGIATYAEAQAAAIPTQQLHIFANEDAIPLAPDGPQLRRVWRSGLQDDLVRLGLALRQCNPDVIVFQFNFGFFRLDALSRLIDELRNAGKSVHLVLHSTADVQKPDLNISLRDAAPALARATRLIVHALDDLNRLKEFGLHKNAMLFPHGVPIPPTNIADEQTLHSAATRTREAIRLGKAPLLATFGFLLPNKGLKQLIESHRILLDKARRHWVRKPHLLMVNALYPAKISEDERDACLALVRELELEDAVTLITDYLQEQEALALLRMADFILYPYQESQESASGAVHLGLASGRPVAVTPLSIFDDVRTVTHQLPGISPSEIATGTEHLLRAAGLWQRLAWRKTRVEDSMTEISGKQAAWVDACAWPNLAHRFWGMLRATAPGRPFD